jgi:plastocyanin
MKKTAAALFASALLLAGCGGSESDGGLGSDPSAGVTVDIAIKDGKVTPQGKRVDVKVGQKITLHVTSDADEEVHVHSEPEHEYELAPGDDKTYSFSLKVPGQVAVEAHHLDVTIAQLVVRP